MVLCSNTSIPDILQSWGWQCCLEFKFYRFRYQNHPHYESGQGQKVESLNFNMLELECTKKSI